MENHFKVKAMFNQESCKLQGDIQSN